MSTIISHFITALITAVVTYFGKKFHERIIQLQYSVSHTYLAASSTDHRLGTMKVTFNEEIVDSLYLSRLIVENPTSRDLENIVLKFICDDGSKFLTSNAKKSNSLMIITYSNEYIQFLKNDSKIGDTSRDYLIPVLNRGERVEFDFVTTNFEKKTPGVWTIVDHKGISIKKVDDVLRFMGEPQVKSTQIGAFTVIFLAPLFGWLLKKYLPNTSYFVPIMIAVILGMICLPIGAYLSKFGKFFIRIFK